MIEAALATLNVWLSIMARSYGRDIKTVPGLATCLFLSAAFAAVSGALAYAALVKLLSGIRI